LRFPKRINVLILIPDLIRFYFQEFGAIHWNYLHIMEFFIYAEGLSFINKPLSQFNYEYSYDHFLLVTQPYAWFSE